MGFNNAGVVTTCVIGLPAYTADIRQVFKAVGALRRLACSLSLSLSLFLAVLSLPSDFGSLVWGADCGMHIHIHTHARAHIYSVGDTLLYANGKDVANSTHADVLSVLKSGLTKIALTIKVGEGQFPNDTSSAVGEDDSEDEDDEFNAPLPGTQFNPL